MDSQMNDIFLIVAGIGGMVIAAIHGRIGQTVILARITGLSRTLQNINTAVFQLSTLYWFVGGATLVLAPFTLPPDMRTAIAVTVAFMYLAGAAGNLWATRGRHFGWPMLTGVAILALIGA
jgi:hypothetical protein